MRFRVGDRKRVYFHDFVKVLSHFRPINKNNPHPWNSREGKLRCKEAYLQYLMQLPTKSFIVAFTMYDLNRSGTITKDEFTEILEVHSCMRAPTDCRATDLHFMRWFRTVDLRNNLENDRRKRESREGRVDCRKDDARGR